MVRIDDRFDVAEQTVVQWAPSCWSDVARFEPSGDKAGYTKPYVWNAKVVLWDIQKKWKGNGNEKQSSAHKMK